MVTWEQTPERQVRRSCVDSPRKSVLGEGTSPKALNWNTPGRFQEQELSERSRRATGTEGHRETRVPTAALGAPFCCQKDRKQGRGPEEGERRQEEAPESGAEVPGEREGTCHGAGSRGPFGLQREAEPIRTFGRTGCGAGVAGRAPCLLGERAGNRGGRADH